MLWRSAGGKQKPLIYAHLFMYLCIYSTEYPICAVWLSVGNLASSFQDIIFKFCVMVDTDNSSSWDDLVQIESHKNIKINKKLNITRFFLKYYID